MALELWLQPVDAAAVRWAESQTELLDAQEMQRWRRYRSDSVRAHFLVAHVTTRHVLSTASDRPPDSWQFEEGEHGRPEIVDGPAGMRFNMSHTEGMVAVLLHGDADCGVDVEQPWRPLDIEAVARRVFTQAERASIFSLPVDARAERFFHLWTLKEAFIKATGTGLTTPLQQFSFALDDGNIAFDCDPAVDSAPNEWRFETHRPRLVHSERSHSERSHIERSHIERSHIVSVAVHQPSGSEALPVEICSLNVGGAAASFGSL